MLAKSTQQLCISCVVAFLACITPVAHAGNVDVNVHIGEQPRQVIVSDPLPQPARSMVVEDDIEFIQPSPLGFYVAVGVPYDLFYLQNRYYLFRDGRWFVAPRHQGPWAGVSRRELPPGLRRHKIERIRHYRDEEFVGYRRDREHYRGEHFRSSKEVRNEEKARRKDDKRWDKEERKDEKRMDKEERKDEKRRDKEERKEHRGGNHGGE